MPCLSHSQINRLSAPEKECVDRLSRDIEDAINSAKNAARTKGIDEQLISRATISLLLITAASTVVINSRSLNEEVVVLSFMRCAAKAMQSIFNPYEADFVE